MRKQFLPTRDIQKDFLFIVNLLIQISFVKVIMDFCQTHADIIPARTYGFRTFFQKTLLEIHNYEANILKSWLVLIAHQLKSLNEPP
jgi:hypothetical protein